MSSLSYGAAVALTATAVSYWLDLLGARYRCKVALYYSALLVNSALMCPACVAAGPGRVENMLIGAKLMRPFSWLFGLRWELSGSPHHLTSSPSPFVVVVNHQHSLDVLGLLQLWPSLGRCATVAKRQLLLFSGSFGLAGRLAGTVYIDRGRGRDAREAMAKAVEEAAREDVRILVFPEGTRHHSRLRPSLLPFKTGAFSAAAASGVPVLPVVFSHYSFLEASSWARPRFEASMTDPFTVRMTVLDPVPSLGRDPQELAEEVRGKMLEELKRDFESQQKRKKEN